MSDAIVKNLNFGDEARDQVFKGIEKLTKAVSSTLGASGKCVMLEDNQGKPLITKDGVKVIVTDTPYVTHLGVNGDRYSVVVSINYKVYI